MLLSGLPSILGQSEGRISFMSSADMLVASTALRQKPAEGFPETLSAAGRGPESGPVIGGQRTSVYIAHRATRKEPRSTTLESAAKTYVVVRGNESIIIDVRYDLLCRSDISKICIEHGSHLHIHTLYYNE
jgi:hypothetical protein